MDDLLSKYISIMEDKNCKELPVVGQAPKCSCGSSMFVWTSGIAQCFLCGKRYKF